MIQNFERGYSNVPQGGIRELKVDWARNGNRVLLATFGVYILYSFVISLFAKVFGNQFSLLQDTLFQLVSGQLVLLAPSLIFFLKNKKNPLVYLRLKMVRIPTILLTILFAYASYPLISLCNVISMFYSKNMINDTVQELFGKYPVSVCVLAVAMLPCVVEETIFRGLLYQSYKKKSVWKAMVYTAILFGMFHLNLNQLTYAIVMGAIFVLLNEASGSLLTSMIMHFTINATSVVSAANEYQKGTDLGAAQDALNGYSTSGLLLSLGVMTWIGIAFMLVLLWGIMKLEKRDAEVEELRRNWKKSTGTIFSLTMAITFAVCLVLIVMLQLASTGNS